MAQHRVQRRSILLVVLATLIPLLIVSILVTALSYRAARRSAQQEQIAISQLVARDFSQLITTSTDQLEVFGETLVSNSDLFAITNNRLFPLVLSNPLWSEVGFYTLDGMLQASAFRAAPSNLPFTLPAGELEQVRANQTIYIDPTPSEDETPRLRVVILLTANGAEQGIMAGEIAMDQFWTLNTTLDNASATRILITNAEGRLLSAQDAALVAANRQLLNNPLIAGSSFAEYSSIFDEEVLGVRETIPETGWFLLVERPLELIYADVNQLIFNMGLVELGAIILAVIIGWLAGRRLSKPIERLHQSVEAFGSDPSTYVPVDIDSSDELGALGSAFNMMAARLRESQQQMSKSNERLELLVAERTAKLEQGFAELQTANQVQQSLLDTVRRLGIPVVPITREVVIMTLVGEMNNERAADITPRLLEAIQAQRAKIALVDVTGIPVIDTHVAQTLIRAVDAAGLLGTQVIMVGIRPEIAQTLVSLSVDFQFMTAASLEQGFALAQSMVRRRA